METSWIGTEFKGLQYTCKINGSYKDLKDLINTTRDELSKKQ